MLFFDHTPRTVVISDIHLGIEDAYAQIVHNRPLLCAFLRDLADTPCVERLVIAGDFMDEWVLPCNYPSYVDSAQFFRQVAAHNADVMDALRYVIARKPVIYLPGNHDMLLTAQTLAELLPGIEQARDAFGLGRYWMDGVVIEHGHRYDAYCAPDPVSRSGRGLLPPEYFGSRLGITSRLQGLAHCEGTPPVLPAPDPHDKKKFAAYLYERRWADTLYYFVVQEAFDQPLLTVHMDGFDGAYALSDLAPRYFSCQQTDRTLYAGFAQNWEERQRRNHVHVYTPFIEAATLLETHAAVYGQHTKQYFECDDRIDMVVFGHSHMAGVQQEKGKLCLNSGTWIDHSLFGPTATFVVIENRHTGSVYQYLSPGNVQRIG